VVAGAAVSATAAVDLAPTAEQEELRRTVRRFLAERSPEAEVRRVMATGSGVEPAVWSGLADLGVLGLLVPEQHGGSGHGMAELAVVLEEAGRALRPAPLLSSAVLVPAVLLAAGDDDAAARLLPGLADGTRRAALVVPRRPGDVVATGQGAQAQLSGRVALVLDGHTAEDLVVVVREGDATSLYLVDAGAPGVRATRAQTLDLTRPMATVELDAAPGALVGERGAAGAAVERALALGCVALACDAVGGGDAVLAAAVEYALQRRQFGRLIGSFQAVKHLCADVLCHLEPARAAAAYAARVADTADAAELAVASAVAKASCADAYVHAAGTSIQVHGGIGFTWEHPAHLYLKRAKTDQVLLGDAREQRARLARVLGLAPAA
jgi:alkylation response protein AidB-like acyl-CoA dehydrogenase